MVTASIRPQPVLLGQKVVQRYFRGDRYMETDVYVGSSVVAANIVGLTRGYTRNVSTNIGLVMQGETEEELPESLLSCGCLREIDVDMRFKLDSAEAEVLSCRILSYTVQCSYNVLHLNLPLLVQSL